MVVKITELNETTTPVDSDVIPIVTSTGSAPETQKIRFDNLFAAYAKAAEYLALSGGTLTGQVSGITPTAAAHLTRKDYVDTGLAAKLSLAGGVMTGDLELHTYQERESSTATETMAVDFTGTQLQATTYTGALIVTWNNLPSVDEVRSTTLVVAGTVTGITWPAGTKFAGSAAPEVDGETWLTAVARGSSVTVFLVATTVGTV